MYLSIVISLLAMARFKPEVPPPSLHGSTTARQEEISKADLEVATRRINTLLMAKEFGKAESVALALASDYPKSVQALKLLALFFSRVGKGKGAAKAFAKITKLKPSDADAHNNLGLCLFALEQFDQAIACYRKALSLRPKFGACHMNLGIVCEKKRMFSEAARSYRKALEFGENSISIFLRLARTLVRHGDTEAAISCYRRALELYPHSLEAWGELGILFKRNERNQEAISCYQKALEIDPDNPGLLSNLGNAWTAKGDLDQALEFHVRAVELNDENAVAQCNLAAVYKELGHMEKALACLRRAIKLDPDNPAVQIGSGFIHLSLGNYLEGWKYFEARKLINPEKYVAIEEGREWRGQPLEGKGLLVYADQGIGDKLQFIRFLANEKFSRTRIALAMQRSLQSLLRTFPSNIELVDFDSASREEFDFENHLLSLPRWLGIGFSDTAFSTPYLFPEIARVEKWKKRIGDHGFRIGIAWQGNPNSPVDEGRSVHVSSFLQLSKITDVRLISLQKGYGSDQLKSLPSGSSIESFEDEIDRGDDAFVDTAAIIDSLDLVVTTDTSIAHLAGALAAPVWLLLKKVPDWRWGLSGDTTPWYSSMKIFRQDHIGEWEPVFQRVASEIAKIHENQSI